MTESKKTELPPSSLPDTQGKKMLMCHVLLLLIFSFVMYPLFFFSFIYLSPTFTLKICLLKVCYTDRDLSC